MASKISKNVQSKDRREGGWIGKKFAIMAAVFLFLGVAVDVNFAEGSFTKKMISISENLERALSEVLAQAQIEYTEPNVNVSYLSTTEFNDKGMAHLYNLTTMFIDVIQKKEAYPEGLLEVHDGHIEIAGDLAQEWKTIAVHYVGIATVVIVAVVFAVLLPIIGFCFCCCRCAGKCGGRSQPFDKKHDKCRKITLATFLICVTTLFMFGLVCTFVTNERMQDGAYSLPASARAGVRDTRSYLNATHAHVVTLLNTNYKELQGSLLNMLNTGGANVSEQLAEFSKAVSVTTLNTMVEDLDDVKGNLINMRRVTNDLRANASQLSDGLRKVKRELLHTLSSCNQRQCRDILIKYKIGELDTSGIDFNILPDVSELLAKVSSLIDGNIQEEVKEGQAVFNKIKQSIENSVNEQRPILESAIENAGKEISQFSKELDRVVINANLEITNTAEPNIDLAEKYINQYSIYRWYVSLGVCCILLLILTCVVMGLLCGICGKRPDDYGDDCCNKGAGSKFLMLGVALMFLLGILLIAITLIYFLIGVVIQRAICDPLRNPADDQLFTLIDEVVNLEEALFKDKSKKDFNMSYVITTCHQNKSIYDVLRLDKIVDLKQLKEKSEKELSDKIQLVYESISFKNRKFVILKESAKAKLLELSDSGLSDFPFDRFTEVLANNITSIDLLSLAKQLQETADKLLNRPEFSIVTATLKNQALHLESYQINLVNPMIREAEMLNETASALRDGLKFNHSSFKEAVINLINETVEAEQYLSTQGPEAIKNLTRVFASSIAALVSGYLGRVEYHAMHEVGLCGPLSNVYNATLTASCGKILLPFNGFWFAAFWCILLFIPLIILSVKLATLYQKLDPYPGPLVEAKDDLKRNSSNIEEKIRDFEARTGQAVTVDLTKFKQPPEVSKSPRTSFGRPIKFSFKSSYSSEFEGKIDDRTLPIGTKYSSKDECYTAIVPEEETDDEQLKELKEKISQRNEKKLQDKKNAQEKESEKKSAKEQQKLDKIKKAESSDKNGKASDKKNKSLEKKTVVNKDLDSAQNKENKEKEIDANKYQGKGPKEQNVEVQISVIKEMDKRNSQEADKKGKNIKNVPSPTDNNKSGKENVVRDTAVTVVDSILNSAQSIVQTKLVDKPGFKDNLDDRNKNIIGKPIMADDHNIIIPGMSTDTDKEKRKNYKKDIIKMIDKSESDSQNESSPEDIKKSVDGDSLNIPPIGESEMVFKSSEDL